MKLNGTKVSPVQFYDMYHQKNDRFVKVIGENNFTYFNFSRVLHHYFAESDLQKLKVLDIGCGVGTLSLYFASHGAEVTGIDISERAITIARAAKKALRFGNVKFQRGELAKGKREYDLVICSEVVEHVPNETKFLQDINSNLKKSGWLVLTTPSRNNFLYQRGFYRKFDAEVGHLRRYTADSIAERVSRSGLTVLSVTKTEGCLRNLLFTTKLGFLIKFIKGPLIPVFHWFDQATVSLLGEADLIVVARKP